MEKYRKVSAVQDGDGHWYVIPKELEGQFNELVEDEPDYDVLDGLFGHYRTNGDLNLAELYIKIN